jgi:NADPH-dependent ferric siderophore reductase
VHGYVTRTERLTPSMVRVVLAGGDLAGFAMVEATDAYVNLAFRPPNASYPEVYDPRTVRDSAPREEQPARRRYTVRHWDPQTHELTLDFVVHGDDGVAGRWALSATTGDPLVLEGPAGGYRPSATADWHLMVGDESALPAIAASLEVLPAGDVAVARLVCDGADHEVALPTEARLDLRWLHRTGADDDVDLLLTSLRDTAFPAGEVHAFVHGEAEEIRGVRRHLLQERGLTRAQMSCSPYWRRTMADEAWRRVKGDFVAAMEADVA